MDHRSHWRPSRALFAAGLVLVALSTVALSEEMFLNEADQRGAVLDVGGQYLTSADYHSLVTVGEGIVHPQALRGGHLIMEPGYLAKVRLMHAQAPTTGVAGAGSPELVTQLRGNHPNPFNPSTTISFALAQAGHASLKIYDVRGRMVRRLVDGSLSAGEHELRWDGRTDDGARAASGVYFMRLSTNGFSDQRKMVLSR